MILIQNLLLKKYLGLSNFGLNEDVDYEAIPIDMESMPATYYYKENDAQYEIKLNMPGKIIY